MFIDKNSLIVNGVNIGQYILDVKFEYHKLWGKDSGRNLAGEQSGTLLGIFPKLVVNFRKLTKEEFETLVPILDSAYQSVTYYDPYKRDMTTMTTYTGDYSVLNKYCIGTERKNDGFSCSFIATKKRT